MALYKVSRIGQPAPGDVAEVIVIAAGVAKARKAAAAFSSRGAKPSDFRAVKVDTTVPTTLSVYWDETSTLDDALRDESNYVYK